MPRSFQKRLDLALLWKEWLATYASQFNIGANVTALHTANTAALATSMTEYKLVNSSANKFARDTADTVLQASMRDLKIQYLHNPPVSDTHLDFLQILHAVPSKDPIPVTIATANITRSVSAGEHLLKLYFALMGALPVGQWKAWYRYHVFFAVVDPSGLLGNGASGYTHIKTATDCGDDLTNSFATKRRSYILDFDAQDRGLEVLFCIRLVNQKDQDGPWGPVFSTIVP
ncbi:hypothetical protein FACS1894137_02240 [Spirochaetia bacterium]|nr:hypothetical protein FACS1894137_02240 [Spirochaetia bacterium]